MNEENLISYAIYKKETFYELIKLFIYLKIRFFLGKI